MVAFRLHGIFFSFKVLEAVLSAAAVIVFSGIGIWKTLEIGCDPKLRFHSAKMLLTRRILGAGSWTGFGVFAMHYLGMYSMVMPEGLEMSYNWSMVVFSLFLAIVVSTASFTIFLFANGPLEQIGAAFVMAAAVTRYRVSFFFFFFFFFFFISLVCTIYQCLV
jgi:NO-binding membrane sensor protein with MHYT domain